MTDNKKITHIFRTVTRIFVTVCFAFVWITWYNQFTFQTYRRPGAVVTIILWFVIYSWLCDTYKAFRIASTSAGEIIFSQVISFGIADLLAYALVIIAASGYIPILPGIETALVQIIGTAVITTVLKRYLMKHMRPKRTLIVYGRDVSPADVENFKLRLLEKYRHLFDIRDMLREDMNIAAFADCMERSEQIILYSLSRENRLTFMENCLEKNKPFFYTPSIEDILCQGSSTRHFLDTPLNKYDYVYQNPGKQAAKRVCDIIFSLIFLAVLSPVMLVTALAIKAEDGGPVFFRQKRYTKDARVFEILKFRSMVVNADSMGVNPTTDRDPRITRVGRVIRATRIDELPQLLNILKGDMSFVGPRPERTEHVEMYTKEVPAFRYRLKVRGGLTGYAQVYGKYNTSPYDKLRLDLLYIENQSLLLDFKLILLTFRTIFQKESTEGFTEEQQSRIHNGAEHIDD